MKLLKGLQSIEEYKGGTVATIGNFDGVHKGHQALLHSLRMEANKLGLPLVVIIFEPQPGEFFQGAKAPARISSLREKLQVLKSAKVDYVCCLKFNSTLSSMDPTEFAARLFSTFNPSLLMIGKDFRFGRDRLGDVSLLEKLAIPYDSQLHIFPDHTFASERVSSTNVRRALEAGNLQHAHDLLGRTYSMCGRVVKGKGMGRQWGIPTVNLNLHRLTLPLKGVLAVRLKRSSGQILWGVANLGTRPTVDGTKNILEVHLFDFDESLYGEIVQVFFKYKLRDEQKFASVEALIQQIHIDIQTAKEWIHAEIVQQRDFTTN